MKQIICIKWGDKYNYLDVNNLYMMIKNNITPPFTLTCFTDNKKNLNKNIKVEKLPNLDFELRNHKKGQWGKCRLWNLELGNLKGNVLFLDLDIIIVSNIDNFFEHGNKDSLMLGRNIAEWNPLIVKGQTSFFRFPVGKLSSLLEKFKNNQKFYQEKYNFEQTFVSNETDMNIDFWPIEWINHFRYQCVPIFPLNYFYTPYYRNGCKIINFCGGSVKYDDAICGKYYFDKYYGPIDHILEVLKYSHNPVKILEGLRKYILPCKWIKMYIYYNKIY